MVDDKPSFAADAPSLRQPHAALELGVRRLKGLKIERLLQLKAGRAPICLLEIGSGSGGIANYFGTHQALTCIVDAVDVNDTRVIHDGYRFQPVSDTTLPFADHTFDVVISNHVIEHVGDENAQRSHLAELSRVMRPEGVAYFAVPNRWMVVEPHFKLPFLSWLPQSVADSYVRKSGKGTRYDCLPLDGWGAERLLIEAGFSFEQKHREALLIIFELERPDSRWQRWVLRSLPNPVFALLRRVFPTLIYVLRKL